MDILVDFVGQWGLGDLLCADPMMLGLHEKHGHGTRLFLRGKVGNLIHNPLVTGMAETDQTFAHTVAVTLFTHMDKTAYGQLEAMPSLIDHMCSYANVRPSDRRPRLHLQSDDLAVLQQIALPPQPRIALCADFVDPLRHWPIARWRTLAKVLQDAGAHVISIGQQPGLGIGLDLCGKLTMRETAALLTRCDLFVGNNSGPFHYAQAAGVSCVTLFSLATPQRFVHPGATVHAVRAEGLPCLECMSRCFAAMQTSGCIASPRGRCMTDIPIEPVLEAIDRALQEKFAVANR
jgi:ADP-heptose:LPS heptosyltransferase